MPISTASSSAWWDSARGALAAILRVRRLLDELDVLSDPDWAARAAALGWYDQSHMVRDFKRYTGVTPTAYVAAQRDHLEASELQDASGFVPQGPPRQIKSVQDQPAGQRR